MTPKLLFLATASDADRILIALGLLTMVVILVQGFLTQAILDELDEIKDILTKKDK